MTGEQAAGHLFAADSLTAPVVASKLMAVVALPEIRARRLCVPEDPTIVATHDSFWAAPTSSPTTLGQSVQRLAEAAARLLVERIEPSASTASASASMASSGSATHAVQACLTAVLSPPDHRRAPVVD